MINNYVKLKLIPKPDKKKYGREHLAYLVAITILKQVLTIPEVRDGIVWLAEKVGPKQAYNLFCQEQERELSALFQPPEGERPAGTEVLALRDGGAGLCQQTDGGKNAGIGVYLKTMIPGGDRDEPAKNCYSGGFRL